jgi:hypothetical protein
VVSTLLLKTQELTWFHVCLWVPQYSIVEIMHNLYYLATVHVKGCDARGERLEVGAYETPHDAAA